MFYVCYKDYGTTIQIAEFDTRKEAEDFMNLACCMEDGTIINSDEMFIIEEEPLPFCEPIFDFDLEKLPF